MIEAKSVTVTVETVLEDGRTSKLVFEMDSTRFKMTQEREVRPVYDGSDSWNFGKPVHMEVDPYRRGTSLQISGFIKAGRKERS
jgi:hypothetical protein